MPGLLAHEVLDVCKAAACLELARLPGWEDQLAKLRRIERMMRNLC